MAMEDSCAAIYQASRASAKEVQMEKVTCQPGFFCALDQSGGSTPKALKLYGIQELEYSGEVEMMDKVHAMRTRIITNPKFHGAHVIGAILFEGTMDREIDGIPAARYLWEAKRIVPFLKIDKGLNEEERGVQLMRDIPQLDELLDRAVAAGIFGTKARSLIKLPNPAGIRAAVDQQLQLGRQVIGRALVPILEPEVDINSPDKAGCERLLRDALLEGLEELGPAQRVVLKLTLPDKKDFYRQLVAHPRVLRVVALSGGYSRQEACRLLAENRGMVASFSRAFLQDLRATQTDEEFTKALNETCKEILQASRT